MDNIEEIKNNYVLDKLAAAGIEVVTDKNEFDKILENHNILQKMETSSTEEKNPLFLADEKELKAFAQKVDDWKAGKLVSGVTIDVSSTSIVLRSVDIPANKITVSQLVLEKMNSPENVIINKSHGHYLDIDIIKNIPNYLANPVMVFNSESRPGSYVIMTETVDSKNQTVMVALDVNKINANIVVNNITSAYGREENEWFIEQIKLGNLIYEDKKRSLEWTNERGLLLPTQMSTQGSLNVIQKEDIVNKKTRNFVQTDRRAAFTENQQDFLRNIGFVNSIGAANTKLDWKLEKANPNNNKTFYIEKSPNSAGINTLSCYERDNDGNTTQIVSSYFADDGNAIEGFMVRVSSNDRQNNFIIPVEALGKVLSDDTIQHLLDYIDKSVPAISKNNYYEDISNVSFKNKVSNLPAKFISEDIYSSGLNPIGKVLTFVLHDKVAASSGINISKGKHYLIEIQTDNNYNKVPNKNYPRIYEVKWNHKTQSYTDKTEINLNDYDSKTIRNIQYVAVNNCDYHSNQQVQTMTLADGNTYGFAYEGKIYLNPDIMNSEVAVHEYTHLWDNYTQRTNPELWEKGKSIFKNTKFWEEVKSDPNYADIADNDNLLLSEVHSRICGKMADAILTKIAERDGILTKDTVIDWNKEVDQYIYKTFESSRTTSDGHTIKSKVYGAFGSVVDVNTVRDFFAQPMKDLMNGIKITQNLDSNSVIQKYTSDEKGDKSMSYNDITKNDIEFLKKLGCSIDKNNLETLSFIKNYFLPEKNKSPLDEKHLYTMLVMEGFNNPTSKNHSQLAEKLCGIYQNSDSQKKCLNSRLLVLGYINENIKNQKLSNEERIKNLEAIKEKLLNQKKGFLQLIQNDGISKEYKKIIIERALKYNLSEPQKQSVINMAYEKAPLYVSQNTNTKTNGRLR